VSAVPALRLVERAAPTVLAAATALLGVLILPFWPPALAAALVALAGAAALVNPRLGLAVALAIPVFPFGNVAQGAAALYCAFAVGWLVAFWRRPRLALLFVAGPVLAAAGALALMPLVAQPVRGPIRRAVVAALAVLTAVLVAALAGDPAPVDGTRLASLHVAPADSARLIAAALGEVLAQQPALPLAAVAAGLAAAALPWLRRRWRYGVGALGAVLVTGSIAVGTGAASTLLLVVVWGAAAAVSARTAR
jgi:hypothetical protein